MKVEPIGVAPIQYSHLHSSSNSVPDLIPIQTVMSKDEMERLMNLVIYNQFAMAEKLARIVSQIYAGMSFEGLA